MKSFPSDNSITSMLIMHIPYNVMGGMQDNGSWRGPAYTWTNGGIRNYYWHNIGGGDGFDVCLIRKTRIGFTRMSQGGSLQRYNIKPVNVGLLSRRNLTLQKNFGSTGMRLLHRIRWITTPFILAASSCIKAPTKVPAGKLFLLILLPMIL